MLPRFLFYMIPNKYTFSYCWMSYAEIYILVYVSNNNFFHIFTPVNDMQLLRCRIIT